MYFFPASSGQRFGMLGVGKGLSGSAEEFQLGGFVPEQDAGWLRRLPQQERLQGDLQLPFGAHRH